VDPNLINPGFNGVSGSGPGVWFRIRTKGYQDPQTLTKRKLRQGCCAVFLNESAAVAAEAAAAAEEADIETTP
jgi:hypothetical protein